MSRRGDRWSGRTRARGRREHADARSARNAGTAEDDMLTGVMDAAGLGGWLGYHVRRPDLGLVQGPGCQGFPDVVLVHPARRRLLVLELKTERGAYRPGQEAWLDAWRASGADVRTVRPGDLHALEDELLGDRLAERRPR